MVGTGHLHTRFGEAIFSLLLFRYAFFYALRAKRKQKARAPIENEAQNRMKKKTKTKSVYCWEGEGVRGGKDLPTACAHNKAK